MEPPLTGRMFATHYSPASPGSISPVVKTSPIGAGGADFRSAHAAGAPSPPLLPEEVGAGWGGSAGKDARRVTAGLSLYEPVPHHPGLLQAGASVL